MGKHEVIQSPVVEVEADAVLAEQVVQALAGVQVHRKEYTDH